MLDERYKHELLSSVDLPLNYNLPSSSPLATTIAAFMEAIEVSVIVTKILREQKLLYRGTLSYEQYLKRQSCHCF